MLAAVAIAPARSHQWIRVKREYIVGALADRNTCEPYEGGRMLCHDVVIEYAAFDVVKDKDK